MRHRHVNNALGVSSADSNISESMPSRKPTNPKFIQSRRISATTTSEEQITTLTTKSHSMVKQARLTSRFNGYQLRRYVNTVEEKVNNSEVRRQKISENPVILTVIAEGNARPRVEETDFNLPVVSPSEYDYKDYEREMRSSVFKVENQI